MKDFRMHELSIPNMGKFYSKTVALALALITGNSVFSLQINAESEQSVVPGAKSQPVGDYSGPIKTYQTFLEAIKRDDLAAAKACCTISDDNKSGSLDVLVGMWVTFHHFNKVALLHFKEQTSQYLSDADTQENPYLRRDCTDKALDRTLSRVAKSTYKTTGETAKLIIRWEKDDGSPNPVFMFSHEDMPFRNVGGRWKLDCNDLTGLEMPSDFLKPGSWGCAFRDGMNLLNAAIEEIESGKLNTWQKVTEDLEKRNKVLEQKWAEDHHDP